MSVDIHAYMGPYIAVKTPYKDAVKNMIVCPNAACSRHMANTKDKFCPACGTATIPTELPYKKKVNLWEELDYGETLVPVETNEQEFLIPNVEIDGMTRYPRFSPKYGGYVQEISGAHMIEEEIVLFKNQFAGEIKKLTASLGEGRMEICWGLIGWMN